MYQRITIVFCVFLMVCLAAACAPVQPADEQVEEIEEVTLEVEPTSVPPTIPPTPTETPQPTPTNTPEPTETPLPTSTPEPDYEATTAAEEAAFLADKEAEIKAELEELGFDPAVGRLAWVSDFPLVLTLEDYSTHDWSPLAEAESYADFVLKMDVTWESTGGLAMCGAWLRAESYEETAAHYKFLTIRLSGLPMWSLEYHKFDQWQATLAPGGEPNTSVHIDQDQGATNTYIFIAEGNLLKLYINGHRVGQMTISTLSEGQLAGYILQESGSTTCVFDNAWVWDLAE